jgi:aryl-alcohol dehydrogenase-like predicted oxidoreductase
VASVIAGASNAEQIQGNVRAGSWQPSPEVLARVDAIAPR